MRVSELILKLQQMPQDAEVMHLWDGALRTRIAIVYLSKSGKVVTSDFEMVCYDDADRPFDAPTPEADKYWHTEKWEGENDDDL